MAIAGSQNTGLLGRCVLIGAIGDIADKHPPIGKYIEMAIGDLNGSVSGPPRLLKIPDIPNPRNCNQRPTALVNDGCSRARPPVGASATGRDIWPSTAKSPPRWGAREEYRASGILWRLRRAILGGSFTDAFNSPIAISIYLAYRRLFRAIADCPTQDAAAQ